MRLFWFYLAYLGKRFFYIIVTVLVVLGSYCYSLPEFSIGGHLFQNIFYRERTYMATWLYYLEYFVFIFLFYNVIFLFFTIHYGSDKRRKEKTHNRYMEFYLTYLVHYIMLNNVLSKDEKERRKDRFRKFVRNDYSRELVIDTLLQIHHQTKGKMNGETEQVFHDMIPNGFLKSYLFSPYCRHKTIALNAIAEFKIHGFEKYIILLAKRENNKMLHEEALITLVRLDTYNGLIQLIHYNANISLWEVNMIIDYIQKGNIKDIPYQELLNSNNRGMLLLGIILVRLNHQKQYKEEIRKYINYPNYRVREEAIVAFALFGKEGSDYTFLRKSYNNTTERGKLCIIETVFKSPNRDIAIRFLEWVALTEPIKFKTEALKSLLLIDMVKVAAFKNAEDPLVRMACNEVLDINL